jgi:hypothetical protein
MQGGPVKNLFLLSLLCFSLVASADTPPPGTVKAKTYSGDGNTAITATGSALSVNFTNSSLPVTGTFWQATQPVSLLSLPSLAAGSALIGSVNINGTVPVSGTFWQATQPVSLLSLPSLAAGSNTIGNVGINGTVPISGTITATNSANGNTGSSVPTQATQIGGSDGTNLRAMKVSSAGVVSVDGSASTQPVSGTVTANAGSGTFAVSAASLPLPAGAATVAKQPALGTAGSASADVITVQGITSMTPLKTDGSGVTQPVSGTVTANAGSGTFTVDGSGHTQPVSGTFWQATQPVSGTFWQATQPVSGTVTANLGTIGTAATAAKQPALGTAGTASSDVITVQGITSMTALKTDGSGVTQPVSGTVTANAGSGTFAVSGTVTANAGSGTFTVDGSGHTQPVSGTFWQATQPVSGTFWQATQPVSLATAPALVAGSAIIGKVGIDQTTPGTTNGVQVNAALPAGSNVIGHVIVDTAPTTAVSQSGTWNVNATPVVPTALTVKQAAITIGTSAVRLTTDGSTPSSTRVLLVAQLLSTSTANCYFGSSGVTSSSTGRGVQMFAGQIFSFNKDAGDYYAICDTSSQTFFITEQE